jgi:hypothetical protein
MESKEQNAFTCPEGRPCRHLKLEPSWLEELRGPASNAAFARLYQACLDWVLQDRGRLTEDECLDIVSDSLVEELNALLSTTQGDSDVALRLEQTLNRNLLDCRRSAKRLREYKKLQAALAACGEAADKADAERWAELARFLNGFISIALEALPDSEYALLCKLYRLERLGFKPRKETTRAFASTKARQAAALQARAHFLAELDGLLMTAGSVLDDDRHLLESALRLVRSNKLSRLLATERNRQK